MIFFKDLLACEKKILMREKENGVHACKKLDFMEFYGGLNMEEELMRGMIRKLRGIMQFYVEKRDYFEMQKVKGEFMRMKGIKKEMDGFNEMVKGQRIREMGMEFGLNLIGKSIVI